MNAARIVPGGAHIKVVVGLLLLSLAAASQTRQFTIKNNCSETVWLAGAGSRSALRMASRAACLARSARIFAPMIRPLKAFCRDFVLIFLCQVVFLRRTRKMLWKQNAADVFRRISVSE